jgi:hypothetical protein
MRFSDIIGGIIGTGYGAYNATRAWTLGTHNVTGWMDIFFINLSLCIVCYFLNPDINTFNTLFFNGHGVLKSYEDGIVNSTNYFPESPMLFFLFYVSFIFSAVSIGMYTYLTKVTHRTGVDSYRPSSTPSKPSSTPSKPSSTPSKPSST